MINMKESGTVSPLVAILAVVASFLLALFLGAEVYYFLGYAFAQISVELFLIVVPLGYMLYKKVDVGSYVRLEIKPKTVLLGIVCGCFLFLFDVAISNILFSVLGASKVVEESNALITDLSSSPQGLLLAIIALSLAGICEEFTFRGFLQTAIGGKYSFGTAIFVSSLFFAIFLHFDPQGVLTISAFLMGLVLGYIYHHWHSYAVSATAHATMNLIVLAIWLLTA
jgi:membrane protease YdiL (CAAX protease family)